MTSVTVFDPAMCCSTGVCGPQVEPHLARFEADLRWLSTQGAEVTRHNLGQEPGAFAGNDVVRAILQSGGEQALPVILLDGRLRWTGTYPTREELAATLPQADGASPAAASSASLAAPVGVEDAGCCAPSGQDTVGSDAAGAAGGCC